MLDNENHAKRKKLKGSILITVISIMAVMLILMISAISLAGIASRRAFSEYYDDQTNATGRSIVESVIATFGDGRSNEGLGEYILSNISDTTPVEIAVNGGEALTDGFGTVEKLEFLYAGSDDADGYYITGSGDSIIKVTATVNMRGERTTYTQYVAGTSLLGDGESGTTGFITVGNFGIGSGSTHTNIHGPSYTNLGASAYSSISDMPKFFIKDDSVIYGGAIYNSSVEFTNSTYKIYLSKGTGLTVMGDLYTGTGSGYGEFNSTYVPSSFDTARDIPYIYCGGTFYADKSGNLGNYMSSPMNVYAGSAKLGANDMTLKASFYCYNSDDAYNSSTLVKAVDIPGDADYVSRIAGTNKTRLVRWTEEITNPDDTKTYVDHYGDFYTKGSLKLGSSGGEAFNNLYVNQVLDLSSCNVNQSEIHGNMYVNGQLIVNSLGDLANMLKKNTSSEVVINRITNAEGTEYSVTDVRTALADMPNFRFLAEGTVPAWPEGLEREDIIGLNPEHPEYKFVSTTNTAKDQFYDGSSKLRSAKTESGLVITDKTKLVVYSGNGSGKLRKATYDGDTIKFEELSGSELEITQDCTLAGSFENVTIKVNPESEIWINVYDLTFSNSTNIIGNESSNKINFFFPQGANCTVSASNDQYNDYYALVNAVLGYAADNEKYKSKTNDTNSLDVYGTAKILTESYREKFDNSTLINLKSYYANQSADSDNYVPDMYFYSSPEKPEISLKFPGLATITANFVLPNASLDQWMSNGGAIVGAKDATKFLYTYGDKAQGETGAPDPDYINDNTISMIGSMLIGKAEELQNNFQFFYVGYSTGGGASDDAVEKYAWSMIDGYSTY